MLFFLIKKIYLNLTKIIIKKNKKNEKKYIEKN